MSRQFVIHFGVTRSRKALKQECINNLNWKFFTDDWNFQQRRWLVKAAQRGTSWIQMVEPCNEKFKTHRTSEELKTQFETTRYNFNPATLDSSKSRWAQRSTNSRLQSLLFPPRRASKSWTPEEEDWVHQRRMEKADWKDIAAETAVKFGTQRTTQTLWARQQALQEQANTRMRQWEVWNGQQTAWLVQEAAGLNTLATDWDDMASLFETRCGFRRSTHSLKSQYNLLCRRGDLIGHKQVTPAPGAERKWRKLKAKQP